MKERLVKGSNVLDVVRLLKNHEKEHELPELGEREQTALRRRITPTTWYSLQTFDALLQCAHRYVFDGSEAAGQQMGRKFAERLITGDAEGVVRSGQVVETLQLMVPRWHEHFNFGAIKVSAHGAHGARIQLSGYPDMSACHGHCIVGWSMEAAERAGARNARPKIEERPWMHNSVLTYSLLWDTPDEE